MTWNATRMGWMLAGTLCLSGGLAYAQNEANLYLELCRKNGVVSGKTASAPADGAHELRGTVSGMAESAQGYNLLLKMEDGKTVTLAGKGAAPLFNVGAQVRVLIDKGAPDPSVGDLPILAVITEGEVATEQLAREARPVKPQPPRASVPKTTKRSPRGGRKVARVTSRNFTRTRVAPMEARETLNAYKRAIRYFNPRGSEAEIDSIAVAVLNYSVKYQVDARLVMAVFAVESGFNPRATSRAGAMGVGQLMPGTAAGLGVRNAYNPDQNIEGAIKYIRQQLDRYQGKDEWTRLQLALASYNAGPGAVRKYGGVPPYRETQAYVRKVSAWFLHFLGEPQ